MGFTNADHGGVTLKIYKNAYEFLNTPYSEESSTAENFTGITRAYNNIIRTIAYQRNYEDLFDSALTVDEGDILQFTLTQSVNSSHIGENISITVVIEQA